MQHTRGKSCIHGPKHRNENKILRLEPPIEYLQCFIDMELPLSTEIQ